MEVVEASGVQTRNEPQKHPHVGIKNFDQREVFLTDGGEVYRLELCIANLTDNTKIAYVKRYIEKAEQSIADKIKKVETAGQTRVNRPFDGSVAQTEQEVNTKYSVSDSADNQLNQITDDGLTMTYVRVPNQNTQNYGSTYGQNIEPAGEYMSMDTMQGKNKIDGYE